VDSLEIAALLESRGMNDEVARHRYAAEDVFDLSDSLLARMNANGLHTVRREGPAVPRVSLANMLQDYARGPLALIPILVLLTLIAALREVGRWEGHQILAFSLGMTSSMLVTNCFVQAMSRRGAIYLSRGDHLAARAFVVGAMKVAALSVLVIAGTVAAAGMQFGAFSADDLTIFTLAFIALSAVWLAAGVLALVGAIQWLGLGLASGLAVATLVDRIAGSDSHLVLGSCVGFAVAIALIVRAALKGLRPLKGGRPERTALPTVGYLLDEAFPYFVYGSLYMILVFLPHVLGWAAAWGLGADRMAAGTALEVGLTLSLAPIILVGGVAEHAARGFWAEAKVGQACSLGNQPAMFARRLNTFYRGQLIRYLLAFGLTSALAGALFAIAVEDGLIATWLQVERVDVVAFVFVASLVAYWLLGWGLFSSIFTVSLGRVTFALRSLLVAIAATIGVGLPLCFGLGFEYAAVAFIVGAAVFGAASALQTHRLFASADYYYYSSF
jgi:hypothetical protein